MYLPTENKSPLGSISGRIDCEGRKEEVNGRLGFNAFPEPQTLEPPFFESLNLSLLSLWFGVYEGLDLKVGRERCI